ncbi:hypothetical protein GW17_00055310 [Ensete ventricosum]|nr:hypothetical protein GW17_00055310 [Ensete ventricosum]
MTRFPDPARGAPLVLAPGTPLCKSIGRDGRPTTGTILSCLLPLSSALCQHLYAVHSLQFVATLAVAGMLFARSRTPSNRGLRL